MKKIVLIAGCLILFAACGGNIEKKAGQYLDSARRCMEQGNFAGAKLLIDSVRTEFPKAFAARRDGIRLMQEVEMAESERTISYQDSILSVLNGRLEEVKGKFRFEKDVKYQDMGSYVIESQIPENNVGRNYLRGQVDETGRMTIVSNFSGSSYIHHRSVRVSCNDNYVDSPVSDDFYEFKDLGVCYEKCNFTNGEDGGMAAFIAINKDSELVVRLNGDRTVDMKMSGGDKEAISELYSLSLLLGSISEATAIRDEAERHIRFIKLHMNDYAPADSVAEAE